MKNGALPMGAGCGAGEVFFDGAHDRGDPFRLKALEGACQRWFGGGTGSLAEWGGQVVNWVKTQIDQEAATRLKLMQEVGIGDGGVDELEGIAHGPVEA
jgi:hypothetical protein